MIYKYKIKVRFIKGEQYIIKEYSIEFLNVGELFVYLETKHKNNYTLISIKPDYSRNRIYGKFGIK